MKKPVYLILFFTVLFACSKTEVEKIEDFSGDSGTFTDSRDGHIYKWCESGIKSGWQKTWLFYLRFTS